MRIFYALTFYPESKEQISKYRDLLANRAIKGRFTPQENFHLTLVFIGEVQQKDLDIYEQVLDDITLEQIQLRASHFGKFKKKKRDILWLGIEKNKTVNRLVHDIKSKLNDYGIETEKRKFSAHITLGRQVLIEDINDLMIQPFDMPIKSVALMVSHRKNDQLLYEPLYEVSMNS